MLRKYFALFILVLSTAVYSQPSQNDKYNFSVDLTNVADDRIMVDLITPVINSQTALYRFPAMVPGTYSVYNFGRYISDLKAFDSDGNELQVAKPDINTWAISGAEKLNRISYKVRETFGDTEDPRVFEPAGTCIDEGKVFVFNNHGFFGYFEGMVDNDYQITFTKPAGFYGSTSLPAFSRDDAQEVFYSPDYHEVVDNPIMFCKPDTATIVFDEMTVLLSVYSPGKGLSAKDFQKPNQELLQAIRKHLGGTLPADRYTFLYYFAESMRGATGFGALEHKHSSFYHMPDVPAQAKNMMVNQLKSTNAHEFYHIVTPLNLHSEEIGNFDYNNPVMSKHLWLYEGVTEYFADYIQLREGLMDMKNYLGDIEQKLNGSMRHNDSLPFTEMSKGALDKYENEYLNVYQKGALIGLCLDIVIRRESNGTQGLQDVINKLLLKYGKDKAFRDDDLFEDIEQLTSPKVREFLDKYVAGPNRIPYDEIFSELGLNVEYETYQVADAGGVQMGFNEKTFRLLVSKIEDPDKELVKQLGLMEGDELVSMNGTQINFMNAQEMFGSAKKQFKPGDKIELVVARKNGDNFDNVKLNATIEKTKTSYEYTVTQSANPNAKQKLMLNAWLGSN